MLFFTLCNPSTQLRVKAQALLLLNWAFTHFLLPFIPIPFNFSLYDTTKAKPQPVQEGSLRSQSRPYFINSLLTFSLPKIQLVYKET